MSVKVANTAASLSGKTLSVLDADETIVNLKSFNRGTSAPFAVNAGAAPVDNLDVKLLEGLGRKRALGYYDLKKDFSAVGDGSTNDRAFINTALSTLGLVGGGRLYVPPGDYRVAGGQLNLNYPNVHIFGDDAERSILLFDDEASLGLVCDTPTSSSVNTLLTADTAEGDLSVTVTSAVGLSIGQRCFLQDTGTNTGSFYTTIRNIVGLTVYLNDGVPVVLTTGNAARLYVYTDSVLSGVRIRDLGFQCATATPSNKLSLLFLSRMVGVKVRDCHFNGSTGPLITTRTMRGGSIKDCIFENAITAAGSAIEAQTTTGLSVINNEIEMCTFGIVTSRSPYTRVIGNSVNGRGVSVALGRGIKLGFSSNFSEVLGNLVTDTNLYGIYLQDSAHCTVDSNKVFNVGVDPGEHGIQSGGLEVNFCHHNQITNNTVKGTTGYGITVAPNAVGEQSLYNNVSGNIISKAVWGGIILYYASRCAVRSNTISCPGATIINAFINVQNTTGAKDNVINDNILFNEDGSTPKGISTAGGGGGNIVKGNRLDSSMTYDLHATDNPTRTQSQYSTTEISTDASTNEITAKLFTIAALELADGDGFTLDAEFDCAANANNKSWKIYVGTATLTSTPAAVNNESVWIHAEGVRISQNSFKFWWIVHRSSVASGDLSLTRANSTDDWDASQPVKLVMINGTANAGDINFRMAKLKYTRAKLGETTL